MIAVLTALVVGGILLIACTDDTATTTASCAFVVGDGQNGHDAKLHRVIYPGQTFDLGDSEDISYVPCNSRNYIVSDGTVRDANGTVVGDRTELITATTKSGVPIELAVAAYWTLNQSESAMRDFYNVCFKYRCASNNDVSGEANNSTPGWNDMLGENFGPALERAVKLSVVKANDTLWDQRDPEEFKRLADNTSVAFADEILATLGYPEDLFCGSGNSTWNNPDDPGKGKFTCTSVRIVVDDVQRGEIREGEGSTEGERNINEQRLQNAIALYGPDAGFWLALLDVIDKCKSAGPTCIITIGGANAPVLPIPSNSVPVPAPPATPTP